MSSSIKYPFYGVVSRFFGGIFYGPSFEGTFYDLDEAKACYDSIELDDKHISVDLSVFYENHCETLFIKERKLNLPTKETMGRAKYISRKEVALTKSRKGVTNDKELNEEA